MLGKLFALVDERCCADNPDAATSHEVLLAGHLLMRFMREKLWECLEAVREGVRRDAARAPQAIALQARPPLPCPCPPRAARLSPGTLWHGVQTDLLRVLTSSHAASCSGLEPA